MNDVAALHIKVDSSDAELAKKVLDNLTKSGGSAAKAADVNAEAWSKLARILGPSVLVGAATLAIRSAIDLQDQYVRLSEVAGTTASKMSSFDLSARLSGTSMDSIAQSIAKLGRSLGEARLGDVQKQGIFKALGIDINDGRDAADVFVEVSKAVMSMNDQTVAGAVSQTLLSRGFAEMRPLMKEIVEQGTLVATVTDEQAKAAKELKDRWEKLHFSWDQAKLKMSNDLIPMLESATHLVEEYAEKVGAAELITKAITVLFQTLAVVGSDVAFTFKMVGGEIGVIAAQMMAIARLDFQGAKLIGEEWRRDSEQAKKDLDEFQRKIMNLGNTIKQVADKPGGAMDMGIGLGGIFGKKGNSAEDAIRERMKFEKEYDMLVARTKGFYEQYASAIKIGNEMVMAARKTGAIDEETMIRQLAANEQARLMVLKQSLEEQAKLHTQKGDKGKAEEAIQQAQQIDAQIVASAVLTETRIRVIRDEERIKRLQDLALGAADIQRSNMTELQLLEEQLTQKQNMLDLAAQEGLISDEVWQAQSALIYSKYEAEKTRIHDDEVKRRFSIQQVYHELNLESTHYFLGQMQSMMNSKSRTMFEIGKAAAIGGAIIDTYKAATGAYAALASIPYVGPALGAAAAAAAIVAGMANVSQIRSQQFGGSGGGRAATPTFTASPTTGLPTGSPGAPVDETGTATNRGSVFIQLKGSVSYSRSEVRALLEALNEEMRDGGNIVVEGS